MTNDHYYLCLYYEVVDLCYLYHGDEVDDLSEYLCKWEVFPLMGVYILIGVYATPLMRG